MRQTQHAERFADKARRDVNRGNRAAGHHVGNFQQRAGDHEQHDKENLAEASDIDRHQHVIAIKVSDQHSEREQRDQ